MTVLSAASQPHLPASGQAVATDIEALKERRPRAWTELFEQAYPLVYRFALANVRDRAVAEDIASQVFVDALDGIHRYRDRGRPVAAWLLVITRHRCADWHRRNKREAQLSADSTVDGPESGLATALYLLAALSPEQREVMHLRFVEDLSIEAVARLTGRTPGAVKALQHRAVARLRTIVGNEQRKETAI